MSDEYCGIHWERDKAKVVRFSAASGAKATTVKIELSVSDDWTLSSILRNLNEARRPPPPPEPEPARLRLGGQRALPAPPLQLFDGRSK